MIGITGAGGFIGSHLVESLLSRGEEVMATDIAKEVPPNLEEFKEKRRFHYARCDVKSPEAISAAFSTDTDVILHLASAVGVDRYIGDPVETIDSIVMGTRNVLEFSLRRHSKLVFLSTSEVYGKNPKVPWKEDAERVLGPTTVDRWTYSTSKALCEHMINATCKVRGLPTTIIRPFNVYGPKQRPTFLIPATLRRILTGQPPLVYDSGCQTRCFTYVEDLVRGINSCLESESAIGQTFNLGNESEVTIAEVVKTALRICHSSLQPVHLNTSQTFGNRYQDIQRRVPDCSRAHRILGWKAETSLLRGMEITAEWMKTHSLAGVGQGQAKPN